MFGARDVSISPEAPASGFASLADVKSFLGISGAGSDTRLNTLIAAATLQIEGYCGRILAQRTVTELLDADDAYSAIVVSRFPIISLTSVKFDDVAQTVGDFRASKSSGVLRVAAGGTFPIGLLEFVYEAGYATIPVPIGEACIRLVAALYNSNGQAIGVKSETVEGVGSVTYGEAGVSRNGANVPFEVANLLTPYTVEFAL